MDHSTKEQAQAVVETSLSKREPTPLSDSVVLIIDAQREYVDGKLRLDGIEESINEMSRLLDRARIIGAPVIHFVHHSRPGSVLFNPKSPYVDIVELLAPREDEIVIKKSLPNAFEGTKLDKMLSRLGRKNLIVAGYMTHMCVSSTVRAAVEMGYRNTVVAKATATHDLAAPGWSAALAESLQLSSLAALADRFAAVVDGAHDIPD